MAALMRSPSVSSVVIQAGPIDQKRQNKILMVYNSQVHTKRISSSALLIRSSIENKIFEDEASGIICYKNESGEIICEGYDEGPRLHRKVSSNSYQERETQIINILEQRWLQIIDEDGLRQARKSFAAIEGFDWKALRDTH
ncbi:hypothetical protein Syun_026674 [Stephania yunnanensis]|uniref:Uncharacterized protein n=1 Tax=Stephania yunnanensis TaxID=152371 RepID=A0AAP0HWW2_9MAGN